MGIDVTDSSPFGVKVHLLSGLPPDDEVGASDLVFVNRGFINRYLSESYFAHAHTLRAGRLLCKEEFWGQIFAFWGGSYSPSIMGAMDETLQGQWLRRFGLSAGTWSRDADRRLAGLPFADAKVCGPLLMALFGEVPRHLGQHPDHETVLLAEAFGWCCFSFWQCGSAFPSYPEDHARFLLDELLKPVSRRSREALLLAQLIVGPGAASGRCGFNVLKVRDFAVICESERRVLCGGYELYLKAREKYREYLVRLKKSAEFRADWKAIRAGFPKQTAQGGILHRSLIPERNWLRDGAVSFTSSRDRFQRVFDLFCWKYFFWGMKKNAPLLLKPSVVFTPFGTQIFVPGFLSFDAKRDLDLGLISRLHRARGIPRQGGKMSPGRAELASRTRRARQLDAQARKRGLRGDGRYRFVAEGLGMRDVGDYRQIRFLLGRQGHEQAGMKL